MFLKTCSTVSTRFLWTVLGDQERSPCAIHVKMSMGYHWTAQYDHYAVSKGSVRRCSYICSMRSLAECVNAFGLPGTILLPCTRTESAVCPGRELCVLFQISGWFGESVQDRRGADPPNRLPDHGHMDRWTVREFCMNACSFGMLRWLDGCMIDGMMRRFDESTA